MTLIAGIFSRNNQPLADSACAGLRQTISRNPADEVEIFRDQRSCFAKVDIGAFRDPGFFQDASGALSLLAGEALLNRDISSNRLQDLTAIHEQALKDNWNGLREADGTFCMVHYQPQTGTLSLVADKVGVRPLYFWLDDELVVFASALRILEELSFVPKRMDLRAVTEVVALGTPLADRTPYAGIFRLKPAEIVQITNEGTSRTRYWRWDEIKTESDSEPIRLATVYDRFQSAIKRRNGNDEATSAYLSGGLDSRCIVAALCRNRVRVRTVNFARPGTQDYHFGNDFAEKIGSVHESIPKESGDNIPDYSSLMAKALGGSNHGQWPAERPQLAWSGEGGSGVLGGVNLSESVVALMRAVQVDSAVAEYLQIGQRSIPLKLLRPEILESLRAVIKQGINEELNELRAEDAGRNFYLFLMHNDQRRNLMRHFENIDLHRLEFQLPFFDAGFLTSVIATPLDWCLKHRFYVKWLSLLPTPVTSVPWQAYPGHEPCPLPVPAELAYQWDDSYRAAEDAAQKQRVIEQASELLRSVDFPDQILNRRNLRLAKWIHSRGWRDYRYAIEAAQTYHLYARKCGGEFVLSSG
ncbi:MAG TPA: asparagine synthase-related protein [Pyrinomonadaceae bacterium]|nr:asparagine synthase-related protein [Pyrinomonadaceae bacterium]